MPYITSIERMGIEKGRKQGRLAGQIQLLQRILSIPVEPDDMLLNHSVAQLSEQLEGLQREFDSRQSIQLTVERRQEGSLMFCG
ncbi:hypothetical protein SH139x_004039 [Planctomycetaceae bacterium SH139]